MPTSADPPTTLKNAIAFIDGQNLFRHAKEAFGHYHPNYNPVALHKAVCAANGWRPTIVRFYTGVPDMKRDPEWAGYWNNRVLAMKRAGIVVTTRQLKYREKTGFNANGDAETLIVAQEKGIDIRIALDVVSLSLRKQFDVGVIYSQDQDLNEIVEEVKNISLLQNRHIKLACAFPTGPSASYDRGIDKIDWFGMDQSFYDACLDPRDYRPKP